MMTIVVKKMQTNDRDFMHVIIWINATCIVLVW